MIFDGKAFAREIELELKNKVPNLVFRPKIVSILVGDDPASVLYTRLKLEAAERVGIEFEVVREKGKGKSEKLIQTIVEIGKRADVTGVMVQLPVPGVLDQELKEILAAIPLEKDVDGLRWEESGIMPATVRAVIAILEEIRNSKVPNSGPESSEPLGSELWNRRFVVVGARGAVGRPLVHFLKKNGAEVSEVEWDTDLPDGRLPDGEVVISCVGKEGFITLDMIGRREVVIDVGSPRGDMTKEVYEMAKVAVGVPNGVGPVTIASLLANIKDIYVKWDKRAAG